MNPPFEKGAVVLLSSKMSGITSIWQGRVRDCVLLSAEDCWFLRVEVYNFEAPVRRFEGAPWEFCQSETGWDRYEPFESPSTPFTITSLDNSIGFFPC